MPSSPLPQETKTPSLENDGKSEDIELTAAGFFTIQSVLCEEGRNWFAAGHANVAVHEVVPKHDAFNRAFNRLTPATDEIVRHTDLALPNVAGR